MSSTLRISNSGLAPSRLHLAIQGILLASALTVFGPVHAESGNDHASVKRSYHIAGGSLSQALRQFATSSGLLFSAEAKLTDGKTSGGLNGEYTVEEGFRKLLAGSGLTFTFTADDAVAIKTEIPNDTSTKQVTELPEVTVKAYRYLDEETKDITNLPLPVEKVPQSISILNNDFVKSADLKTSGEIAQYTPGALWASFSPSYGNQIWLRGFAANYAIDGVTVGDQITEPDVAMLDRYEMVKGPASVVYGPQSPGGIVNLVSKRANPDTPSYMSMQYGSWDRYRVDGQISKPLNDAGTIRGIGAVAYQNGGSFIDFVQQNKSVVYGGLDFDLAKGMTAYLRASYQRTENTPYNGLPTYSNGVQIPVSRSFFIGGSNLDNVADAMRLNAGWSWDVNNLWNVGLKAIGQDTIHSGGNAYPYNTIANDGSFPIGGEVFNNWNTADYSFAGSATRKLDDFGLTDSSISANLRYQHYRYSIKEGNYNFGTANIFDGDRAVSNAFNALIPGPSGTYQQDQKMDYLTASSQAVIKVASPLTVVGGISVSNPMIDLQVYNGPFKNFDPGTQVNYRGSLIYEPVKGLNLYGSYSQSYQPNLRVDVNQNVLAPIQGEQYEVGVKASPTDQLLLTAALFQIDERNVAVYDSFVNGEALYKAANVRHRGVEVEATGRITDNWQIKAGGAMLDPKMMSDPTNPSSVGQTRTWLPQTTANLFSSYDFENGISIGGGGRYVGSVKTSYDGSTGPLKSYIVFDGFASYTYGPWRLQLNVKNILDEHYAVPSPIFQALWAGVYPGEPRSFGLSLRRDF